MVRNSYAMAAAALAIGLAVDGAPALAQTTFQACRVPSVGVIYMINVGDAPTACLDASHVQFSWTEGGAPADGSITTAKLANNAVTTAKLAVPPRAAATAGTSVAVTLTSTFASLGNVAITVGGAGSIVVHAAGTTEVSASNCSYMYYGIAESPTGTPTSTGFLNRADFGATGVANFGYSAMNAVYLDTVAAPGTYTYYFVARASSGTTCDAYNNGITAIFIPS
ncbi:MAG: hypothetical protein AB7T31_12045 [Gemmatimonadales bacterium]